MARTASSPPKRSGTPRAETDQPPVPETTAVVAATTPSSQKRGRGRPAKAKSDSNENAAVSAQPVRKSGRPKGTTSQAAKSRGRPKRSTTQVTTTNATVAGSRKRGRPKNDAAAVAPATKRGRKPKKGSSSAAPVAADARVVARKSALLQKKVKEAADALKIAMKAVEVVQGIVSGM